MTLADGKPSEDSAQLVHPSYGQLNPTLPVESIYFYFLKNTTDPKDRIRVFVIDRKKPIPYGSVKQEILTIIGEISGGEHEPCGWGLGDVKWRRKSYLVIVLEDPNGGLIPGGAATFNHVPSGGNHTFKDGQDVTLSGDLTGFFCINHMQRRSGGDLPDRTAEHFQFRVHHRHAHTVADMPFFDHEGTGTNQGPPLGPP